MRARFEGKVALVTGATSGIGRAVAVALADEGAHVVIAGRRSDMGEAVVGQIRARGADAVFVRADVAVSESVERLVAETVHRFGGLDMAFNNAGIAGESLKPTAEHSEDNWHAVLNINLTGVWRCMKHEIPQMLKRGGGAIVNNSSELGLSGSDLGVAPYVASKHGVVGLTRSAAIEYARRGIRVNAVCPTLTATEMLAPALAHPAELDAFVRARIPMGRVAHADEVAQAVLWLLSEHASFVTGQMLAIDGGALA